MHLPPGNKRPSTSQINGDSHQGLARPLPLHAPPGPQQWASLEHKAWIKKEAGQEAVAVLVKVMGGEGTAALLIVLGCSCMALFEKHFTKQLLVFLKQLLAPHE